VDEVSRGGGSMLAGAVLPAAYLPSLRFGHLDRFLSVSWLPILSYHYQYNHRGTDSILTGDARLSI